MMMRECIEEYFGERSVFQVFFTLIRYPTGIALFLLPWVMNFGGIIAGPVIVTIFIVINAYRSHVLTKVAGELTSLGIPSPGGCSDWWVFESCLGKIQRSSLNCYLVIFSALQWISLLGHASAFLAFAGVNLHQVYTGDTGTNRIKGDRICIAICILIVIVLHPLTQWIRNHLQELYTRWRCPTIFSAFIFLLIPSLIAVFFGVPIITAKMAEMAKAKKALNPDTSVHWDKITLLIAGTSFVIGATPDDVTGAFGNLHNQSQFPTILIVIAIATILIGVGYSVAAFLGIGHAICGSITYNMPVHIPRFDVVRALLSSAALLFVSFRHQIEPQLSNRLSLAEVTCDVVFKVMFLALAGAIAVGLPSFSGLSCLFGSVTSLIFTLIFPFLCDLLLHLTGGRVPEEGGESLITEGTRLTRDSSRTSQQASRSCLRISRDVIFIVLGVVGMIAGLIGTMNYLEGERNISAVTNCTLPDVVPPNYIP